MPVAFLALAACGDDASPAATDMGADEPAARTEPDADGAPTPPLTRCSVPADCPPVPPGLHPCVIRVCDAATARCLLVAVDADADGAGDADCPVPNVADAVAGTDCDDSDSLRYPGRSEICDNEGGGHDEDCNTTTPGTRDGDGDGTSSSSCCNVDQMLGETVCGADCDDANSDIHPGAMDGPTENCDGVDNNCDGVTDVGCLCTADVPCGGASDGVHNEHPAVCRRGIQRCEMGVLGACEGAVPPSLEACVADGLDEDCDGEINEAPCDCTDGMERTCGLPLGTAIGGASTCVPGRQGCVGGLWDACTGVIPAGTEVCDTDSRDENCDGTPNEGCECVEGSERACGIDGVVVGGSSACRAGIQRCDGGVLGPCMGAVGPSAEICDAVDNDCDGMLNEEPESSGSCAAPTGAAACVSGACVVSCTAPLADCDSDPRNGCEEYLRTSHDHCGTCDIACGSVESCAAGLCDPVVQLAAGRSHTCALRSSGRVYCWGRNQAGECGVPPPTGLPAQRTPVEVAGLSGVAQIVAGDTLTCARRTDGTVACWGDGSVGQLGNGMLGITSSVPVSVGLANVVLLGAGSGHVCALLADSSMRCWGWNVAGQVGDNTTTNTATPTQPWGPATWFRFAVGGVHTFAVDLPDRDGWVWGDNSLGQFGDGTTTGRLRPGPGTFDGFLALGTVGTCSVGAPSDDVRCWGAGPVGDGTNVMRTSSTPTGITGARGAAVGWETRCAWLRTGAALCWGTNSHGQIGIGTFGPPVLSPTTIPGLLDVRQIVLGQYHSCALIGEGEVRCWGRGDLGELGNGGFTDSAVPVAPSVLP